MTVEIKAKDAGPLLIIGPVKLIDGEGNEYQLDREQISLCRCGQSNRKPFCDGTHRIINFDACERAVAVESSS